LEGAIEDMPIDDADAVASIDPNLIWVRVAD
jgi:hypothetical protein